MILLCGKNKAYWRKQLLFELFRYLTLTITVMQQLSVWEKETFFAQQDVIIIGSGFVGLWCALKLIEKSPGTKITIVERGVIPTGASTRNAGFSCFGSPSELMHDVAAMGTGKTLSLVNLRFKGLQQIRKYFDDDSIGYEASGGFECFTDNSADWLLVKDKLDWLNEKLLPITGEAATFFMADDKLDTFGLSGFDHLIENKLEGGLHSGKLIKALMQKVQALGVQVITSTTILDYENQDGCITLATNQAFTLSTRQLLICTNAFTKMLIPDADIIPNRGQVLLTAPIKGLNLKGTFHFDKGFYYFRNLGNQILIGGARNKDFDTEETTIMQTTAVIQNELERFINTHLLSGTAFTITDRWSGIMAMGNEKLPFIQKVDDQIFCCVRMSGMGVALAPMVADEITALMNS